MVHSLGLKVLIWAPFLGAVWAFPIWGQSSGVTPDCAAVLKDGVFDYYKEDTKKSLDEIIRNVLNSGRAIENSSSSRSGGGLSVPLGDLLVGANASSSDERLNRIKDSFSKDDQYRLTTDDQQYLYRKIANTDLLDRWLGCVKIVVDSQAVGLDIRAERNGVDRVIIRARFKPVVEVLEAHVTSITPDNLQEFGDSEFKAKGTIGTSFRIGVFKILDVNRASTFILKTDRGDAAITIARLEPTTPEKPNEPAPVVTFDSLYDRAYAGELSAVNIMEVLVKHEIDTKSGSWLGPQGVCRKKYGQNLLNALNQFGFWHDDLKLARDATVRLRQALAQYRDCRNNMATCCGQAGSGVF